MLAVAPAVPNRNAVAFPVHITLSPGAAPDTFICNEPHEAVRTCRDAESVLATATSSVAPGLDTPGPMPTCGEDRMRAADSVGCVAVIVGAPAPVRNWSWTPNSV